MRVSRALPPAVGVRCNVATMKVCPQCHQPYPNVSAFCFIDGSSLVSPSDPRLGSTLAGRFVLDAVIGAGRMATVYRAENKLGGGKVAVKILGPRYSASAAIVSRFKLEALRASRLVHPNIVGIYEQGDTDDGVPFLVMDLLTGPTLARALTDGPIPLARALPIAIGIARALARAHAFEVRHNDLRPGNIFLSGEHVKLTDFAITRAAAEAPAAMLELVVAPQYLAPERGTAEDAGPTADLYALGVVIFEMLTQSLPFQATDVASWVAKHRTEPPPPLRQRLPDAPLELDRLVAQLLAKAPEDRPVDAYAVESTLTRIAGTLGIALPNEIDEGRPSTQLPPVPDPWGARVKIFEAMLAQAFIGPAPADLTRMVDMVRSHARELTDLRRAAKDELDRIEAIDGEGRDARRRIGNAMDALNADVSKPREDARRLRAIVGPLHAAASVFPRQVLAAHKEVVRWEGRSGFVEPHRELAAGYAALADLVGRWYEARKAELVAEGAAHDAERALADVDFQLKELRASLSAMDAGLDARRLTANRKLLEASERIEHLDAELLYGASRLCAPLRSKPELGRLFVELARTAPSPPK